MNETIKEKRAELQSLIEQELTRLDSMIDSKHIELQNLTGEHSDL